MFLEVKNEKEKEMSQIVAEKAPPYMPEPKLITMDDFAKVDLRIGTILEAKAHPKADRLVVLQVALGKDLGTRQIVAGIRQHYTPEGLVNKQVVVVANLEPVGLRGEMSHGMLLAAKDEDGLSLVTPEAIRLAGTKVG